MPAFETIAGKRIYFDETYFIAYAGGKRELPAKEQKTYNRILSLPLILQRKELAKIPFENNPNVVPLKGKQLLEFIKELNFIPFFDSFFDQSHLIKLSDAIVYESMRAKSYEVALRGE
jgi:hypothetical protein